MKRMILISENEYNKLKQIKVSTTQSEESVILAPDIGQKIAVSKMIEEKLTHDAPLTLNKIEPLSHEIIKTSIEKFPLARRSKALKLFQLIDQSQYFTLDEKGQLIVETKVIPSSNIIELIYFGTNTITQLKTQPTPEG